MKKNILKYLAVSFVLISVIACQDDDSFTLSSKSFEAAVTMVSLENQGGTPQITTTTTVEVTQGLESKVEVNMNKLADFSAIKINELEISETATALYNGNEITPETIFAPELINTNSDGIATWTFTIQVVSSNGNTRNWVFYLNSSAPPNLQFDAASNSTFDFYNEQKHIGEILVAGISNTGDGKWTFANANLIQWGPKLDILKNGVNQVSPDYDMSDDYFVFNANGTFEFSYGPNGKSMFQNTDNSSHKKYYLKQGVGEWSIEVSDRGVNGTGATGAGEFYTIKLYNYETEETTALINMRYVFGQLKFNQYDGNGAWMKYDATLRP
tara:strand:+ start:78364 stop:79344 length:981 start_codon:yes stop_codon:yes gene_type:complete